MPCSTATWGYLNEELFLIQRPADDKYSTPDFVWSNAVVGKGIYIQPKRSRLLT